MWTLLLLAVLLAISIVDLREMRIPDWANAALAFGGLLFVVLELSSMEVRSHIVAAAFMAAGAWTVRAAYAKLRGRPGLGLGDVKMLGAATLWVGPFGAPTLVLVAALSGLTTALVWHGILSARAARGHAVGAMTAATRIPFGPHLAIGAAFTWLAGPV
ncbi:MAG TPA: A24 family peptidase [Afifellaceae bacterium]|nr:A24 family peptidase [Afifellaceae bacterium]